MRAVVQHGIRDIRVQEWPAPSPEVGEVLVRIRSVTICASDLHIYSEGNVGGVSWGKPFIPGHEAAGVIEDANGEAFEPGAKVVLDPAAPCGRCNCCAERLFHLCRDLKFLDLPPVHGAMRELVAWPSDRVFAIPPSVDVLDAPLIEPLSVAVHAVELARRVRNRSVLVVGCGAIGFLAIQVAKFQGAKAIIATDLIPARLEIARELGADEAIQVGPNDAEKAAKLIIEATDGRGIDVAFEAAGPPAALQQCLNALRPSGEAVIIGIPSHDEYRLQPSTIRRRELSLRFVRRQNENYPEALDLVADGQVRLGPILTHRFPLDRAQEAFDLAERKQEGAIRVAVTL